MGEDYLTLYTSPPESTLQLDKKILKQFYNYAIKHDDKQIVVCDSTMVHVHAWNNLSSVYCNLLMTNHSACKVGQIEIEILNGMEITLFMLWGEKSSQTYSM